MPIPRSSRLIRLVIADDAPLVRRSIRALLSRESEIEVVGEAGDGREAERLVLELRPDVTIMDISMPGVDGLAATRAIRRQDPKARVLVVSVYKDSYLIRRALESGASGYVLKGSLVEELAQAIRAVAAGGRYFSPLVAGALDDA